MDRAEKTCVRHPVRTARPVRRNTALHDTTDKRSGLKMTASSLANISQGHQDTCPPFRVEVLSEFAVLHKALSLGALLAKRARHLPTCRAPLHASAEELATGSDKQALEEKRRRRTVPARLSVSNRLRRCREDVLQPHICRRVEMHAHLLLHRSIRHCSEICGTLVS